MGKSKKGKRSRGSRKSDTDSSSHKGLERDAPGAAGRGAALREDDQSTATEDDRDSLTTTSSTDPGAEFVSEVGRVLLSSSMFGIDASVVAARKHFADMNGGYIVPPQAAHAAKGSHSVLGPRGPPVSIDPRVSRLIARTRERKMLERGERTSTPISAASGDGTVCSAPNNPDRSKRPAGRHSEQLVEQLRAEFEQFVALAAGNPTLLQAKISQMQSQNEKLREQQAASAKGVIELRSALRRMSGPAPPPASGLNQARGAAAVAAVASLHAHQQQSHAVRTKVLASSGAKQDGTDEHGGVRVARSALTSLLELGFGGPDGDRAGAMGAAAPASASASAAGPDDVPGTAV